MRVHLVSLICNYQPIRVRVVSQEVHFYCYSFRLNLNCQNVLNYTTPSEEHIEKSCIELPINPDILEDANHLINRSSRALIKLVPPSRALSGDLDPVLYEVIVLALKKDSIIFLVS